MTHSEFTRRDFIKIAGVGVGGSLLATGCMTPIGPWRFFTEAEAVVIDAIAEQIIPGDEEAGAREAGVINFIDKQLAGVFARHQTTYREGVVGVQQTSRILFGDAFEALAWEPQTDVLRALEAGVAEGDVWERVSAQAFFGLVRDHTMQGFYGSPRHGGNRHFASFKMLGLNYPRIYGQNRYKVFPGT